MTDSLFFINVFIAIFSVLNPIGAIPTLIALTENYSVHERNRVITRSILVGGGVVIGFMFLGVYIFSVLGISISDFEVAGGILLFKVALDMLQGRTSTIKLTKDEAQDAMEKEAVGVVPLGMPLLAGPGTITTAMIYFNVRSPTVPDRLLVIIAVVLVIITAFIILRFSTVLFKKIGKTGSLILSRLMGMLLAAIGVGFVVSGIEGILAVL